MSEKKCFWCKISTFGIFSVLCAFLAFASISMDYQWELVREHVRFRSGFPSQANWITSPYGTLRTYLFNVTNSESFLNGTDTKLKLQQVGPIIYRITGRNEVLNQTESTLTYKKIRYLETKFDAEASCAPDILNQTIVMPNMLLLGTASKLHDWHHFMRPAFNAITVTESLFLNRSVYYFLWDFTAPALNLVSSYIPSIQPNCGMLYNALRNKEEVYNVQIGVNNGLNNFFRVNTLNNKTYFPEHAARMKYLNNQNSDIYCPIKVSDAFDNSLFQPFPKTEDEITVIANEACRTLQFKFNEKVKHLGLAGYRFVFSDTNLTTNCLDNANGIKLHKGIFDVSKCILNDVPSALSSPHFYKSTYNWSQHFEGLSPSGELHETSIIIEPTTGIPIEEKYRFQSNLPMPDMSGYSKDLRRFDKMVLPTFWYEYDLDDLPAVVIFLLRFNIYIVPVAQPICIALFTIASLYCFLKAFFLFKLKFTYEKKCIATPEITLNNSLVDNVVHSKL